MLLATRPVKPGISLQTRLSAAVKSRLGSFTIDNSWLATVFLTN